MIIVQYYIIYIYISVPVWSGHKNVGVRGIAFGRCGDLIWEKDRGGILPLLAAAKAGYRSKAGLHSAVFLPCSQHFSTFLHQMPWTVFCSAC